jgi:hypothetical protein
MWATNQRVQVVNITNKEGIEIKFLVPFQVDRFNLLQEVKNNNVYLVEKGEAKYLLSFQRLNYLADHFEWKFDDIHDISTPCYLYEVNNLEVGSEYSKFELI